MDTWIFFGGRWRLIEQRRHLVVVLTIGVMCLVIGVLGGIALGIRWGAVLTARVYDERIAIIDRTVTDLNNRFQEIRRDCAAAVLLDKLTPPSPVTRPQRVHP